MMAALLDKLRRLLNSQKEQQIERDMNGRTLLSPNPHESGAGVLTEDIIKALMRQLEQTQEGMYSCAETFALLDQYVDMVVSEQDVALMMPLVKAHVDICPNCGEKAKILLRILQGEREE